VTQQISIEEKLYSPEQIAERWSLSPDTVRRLFQDEPGVFKLGAPLSTRGKRRYVTLRIPESVAARVRREIAEMRLIEHARKHHMTPEEHQAQICSLAFANTHLSNPSITRQDVEAVVKAGVRLCEDCERYAEGFLRVGSDCDAGKELSIDESGNREYERAADKNPDGMCSDWVAKKR
jgi:DNA-binding transcriptional regulator YhcF (GntR family)